MRITETVSLELSVDHTEAITVIVNDTTTRGTSRCLTTCGNTVTTAGITMATKKKKKHAGKGAKCTILTKFIHPKITGFEKGHRTTCILLEMRSVKVNRTHQVCFVFYLDGVEHYAVGSHFRVEEEGEEDGFFSLKKLQILERRRY